SAAELAGAYCTRILRYMQKAVREAKLHSSWVLPDADYEAALESFVLALLTPGRRNRFLPDFAPFAAYVARYGRYNSLSQTLLKLTSPGVPDIYQGNELWQFNLVDPDNRHPVDHAASAHMLDRLLRELDTAPAARPARVRALLDHAGDGRAKLFVTWSALDARRRDENLFRLGDYLPLVVTGARAEHLCAYARRYESRAVVVLAPRLYVRLTENGAPPLAAVWGDTCVDLAPLGPLQGPPCNLLTGCSTAAVAANGGSALAVQDVLQDFPVGLMSLRLASAADAMPAAQA
ncbi:MAG: 4-alpha-glucanotransferase, partial [Rhodocyclaceae bacterium]|nr:4-alpha-glucanotransferase [Rhodocyclaceae bacterium]